MADRVVGARAIAAKITSPAGTAEASATTTSLDLGRVHIERVEVVVPTGHAGLTGVQLRYAGEVIVPWASGDDWIVSNGETIDFAVGFDVTSALQLRAYNTDVFEHSFYLRVHVTDLDAGADGGRAIGIVPVG